MLRFEETMFQTPSNDPRTRGNRRHIAKRSNVSASDSFVLRPVPAPIAQAEPYTLAKPRGARTRFRAVA